MQFNQTYMKQHALDVISYRCYYVYILGEINEIQMLHEQHSRESSINVEA